MEMLTCSRCGYELPVTLESDNGEAVTMEDFLAAHDLLGEVIVCNQCLTPDDGKGRPVLEV